jgi:hypothetical protein
MQMAGRVSVEYYVGLASKGWNEREKGNVAEVLSTMQD